MFSKMYADFYFLETIEPEVKWSETRSVSRYLYFFKVKFMIQNILKIDNI